MKPSGDMVATIVAVELPPLHTQLCVAGFPGEFKVVAIEANTMTLRPVADQLKPQQQRCVAAPWYRKFERKAK